MKAFVIGTGSHLPPTVVTNEEIAAQLGVEPDWIYKVSGIRRRRWADPGTPTSSLGAAALREAMTAAQLSASDLDYLLFGTMTPDRFIPGSASAVQASLGLKEIPCLDIRATCCNALFGLQVGKSLIASGVARNVGLCLAEIQSPWLRLSPDAKTTSMLFGDGASAIIISGEGRDDSWEIIDVVLATDGSHVGDLGIRCPGTEFGNTQNYAAVEHALDYAPAMAGQSVILHALRKIAASCETLLGRNQLRIEDVDWLVPHQANANLLTQIARTIGFQKSDGVVSLLEDYGNTSSASMGLALDKLRQSKRVESGDNLLLPAFGAGFTWGAALCRA
ncbi:MAG: 3-oxoacyl-[acyl-carrier-protein] synthase [Blastocatellia bacterium]|jgi:3-oxoacyl-[acyl-carrier-protein] synthase-3|nr:3-oxoacyl-[acyl-carrier-protein] synthase [Blastocatellia bacterium]